MQRPCLSLRAPKAPPRPLAVVVREHPETPGRSWGRGTDPPQAAERGNSGAGGRPGGGGEGGRGGGGPGRGGGGRAPAPDTVAAVCCWAWGAVLLDRVDLRHALGNAAWGAGRRRGWLRRSPPGTAWAVDTASCSDLVPRSSAACRASACLQGAP